MKIRIIILFVFSSLQSSGQQQADWSAFTQRVDVRSHEGKRFRLQAAVKVHLIDSSAQAAIWARVDKPDNKRGFFYNMADKPIRSKEWQVYTIEGRIDKDAEYLTFGGLYFRKGVFFFDDFKLWVETSNNSFEELTIPNGNFENDSLTNWYYNKQSNYFATALTAETFHEGKTSLKIDGRNFKKGLGYGTNDTVGKYASVNGITLYYEEYGAGEPLLLLHGNSQVIEAFTYQIPEFAKQYRVIAVDTRGQGKSTEDGRTYSYDLFAEDMNALLNHLRLDSVNVVGWSDGGNTGLIMAMKYPQKVKKLLTMGANIFIDTTVVAKSVMEEISKDMKSVSLDTSYRARNHVRLMNMLLTEPAYKFDDLSAIKIPVLVVAGENDIIKEGHTRKIAEHISKGKLWIEPKATHYLPVENPKRFNEIVLQFLQN